MFKGFLIALVFSSVYAYAADPVVSVNANLPVNRPLCPFLDEHINVTYNDADNTGELKATLTINCAAAGTNTKTVRYTSEELIARGTELPFGRVGIDELSNAKTGDQCTAAVAVKNNAARNASQDFTIGFQRLDYVATPKITSAVTIGNEFRIENLFVYGNGIPFWDLLLRECTATEDPWVFRYHNNTLKRVYPISITKDEFFGDLGDVDPSNDNECLGRYDGFLGGLFTLGSDYNGCKLKLVKQAVTGGGNFTAMGAPQLAASASVTENAGKVLLNTGTKPTDPAGINSKIIVYVSNDRGQTWALSKITSWTTTAAETGIAATSPSDNTTNMALVAISDSANTKRWWRIVKGK